MKLTQVGVRNYRSLFMDGVRAFTVELADGINALIGPNNCGKSNLLRAVALTLDPTFPFDRERDKPAGWQWTYARVTLDFRLEDRQSYERTLRRYADEYERSVNGGKYETYASRGLIRLRVSFEGNAAEGANRRDYLVAAGAGNRSDDNDLLKRALKQLRSSLRFVLVESGQDLESVLAGNFRDILHNVIRDHLKERFEGALRRRSDYVETLQGTLLSPLRARIREVVADLFPEVTDVNLVPRVSSIEETLSDVTVNVRDALETSLAAKGTGVRGAVLVAMLQYLADQSKRSLVFAVEEPEAFLHPAAQEALRDDVEKLAERPDVTVLMTTHSPFVVSRDPKAKVIALAKDAAGRTFVSGQAMGDESHASLLGGLFRDAALPDILERSAQLPPDARGVVVVEGITDERFIETAAAKCRRPELVRDLHLIVGGGATKAAVQAVLMKAQTAKPVIVVLDDDEPGREAYQMLRGRFGFHPKRELLNLGEFVDDRNIGAEAEDLFPPNLVDAFVRDKGEETVVQSKRARKNGGWRYDLNSTGKDSIVEFVEARARPEDFELWLKLITMMRQRLGLDAAAESGAGGQPGRAQVTRGQARWSWDAYSRELAITAQRIEIGKALVGALEEAAMAAGLSCMTRFNKGAVHLQRAGGYSVFGVDLYWRHPVRLLVKIPDDPHALELQDPYPELTSSWKPDVREWGWTVPGLAQLPDVSKLIPIARRFHFDLDQVATPHLPSYQELLWPTLKAVEALGGSAGVQQIVERVCESEDFTAEQRNVLHGDGRQTEIGYRVAWALSDLKAVGAMDNRVRGVWSINERGRRLRPEDMASIPAQVRTPRD